MASLFALFAIEVYLKSKTGGHSHGGPTGEGLSKQGAPPGVSSPPVYQGRPDSPDSMDYDNESYPDEKDLAFVK